MQPLILLAVLDEKRQQVYEEFFRKEQVAYRIVMSLRDVISQAAKHPHSGILIDMPIIIKASQYEKSRAEDTLRALPSAWVNISKTNGEVVILDMIAESGTDRTASEFVRYCCELPPKIVHARNRVQVHFNALLAMSADMSGAVKTVCIDISEGGCFLFSADELLIQKMSVWVQLPGLHDQTPIKGAICWKRNWGQSNKIPGIGIQFEIITGSQLAEIKSRIK